jgi:septum formation protein
MKKKLLILGSSSPSRLQLLKAIKFIPDIIISPDVEETPLNKETPRALAKRLAEEKNKKIQEEIAKYPEKYFAKNSGLLQIIAENKYAILTADTVAVKGRRVLEKSDNNDIIKKYLEILSGGNHRVYTGICIFDAETAKITSKISESRIKIKTITKGEIEFYLSTEEGRSKAGGYAIAGCASRFVEKISGSVSGISGLDTRIVANLLSSSGFGFSHNFYEKK